MNKMPVKETRKDSQASRARARGREKPGAADAELRDSQLEGVAGGFGPGGDPQPRSRNPNGYGWTSEGH